MLKWSPADFWSATYLEITSAYVGHCQSKGTGWWAPNKQGWTRAAVADFRNDVASMMDRHPDTQLTGRAKAKRAAKEAKRRGD